ncbi:MAG TPA: hypothetical protein PLU75_06050 [Oscillospiraceae bacterium]|nr:hypothetical protein [Oscillospiraceae bacterium]HRW57810.1 hypothetical protein [Oscillospiraceae bacterium]
MDEFAFTDAPPLLTLPEIDEVHVSVAFTYDLPRAEWLAEQWEVCGVPVKMGGPAFNEPGGDFVPGMYLKQGYVITSRGCPNHCWFCAVPKRDGGLRELPITDGHIVQDDNLLACSESHIKAVFEMLGKQKERAIFSGVLEAKLLKPWHVEKLREIKTARLYMAYDTPDDYEPLVAAGKMLAEVGYDFASRVPCCYVLIGYRGDTFEKAEKRLHETINAGFVPYAMLYRDEAGKVDPEWSSFQRLWARPAIITAREKDEIEKAAHPDGGKS